MMIIRSEMIRSEKITPDDFKITLDGVIVA